MSQTTAYRVSWVRAGTRPETREFADWGAAIAYYEELVEDHRTLQAKIIEVSEKEVRCMEHERALGN